jgi:ubiquinone/menaquinone biosynthesis C-methylase UbiE
MPSPLTGVPEVWNQVAEKYQRHVVPDFTPAARTLCGSIGIHAGDAVLDVACGPGTATFVAEDFGAAPVIGIDFARRMIVVAQRQPGHRKTTRFVAAEASALPFPNRRFDALISSFGLIFAPEPIRAGAEAARVLKPGGRLGLLAWQQEGTVAAYQRISFRYLETRPGTHDPLRWGEAVQARAWLEDFREVEVTPIEVPFYAESALAAWHVLRTAMGRIAAGYAGLEPPTQQRLDAEMVDFFERFRDSSGRIYWPREAMCIRGIRQ